MTQKEFIQKKNAIHEAIASLKKEWTEFVESYRNENSSFKVGDKVKIVTTTKTEYAYVHGVSVAYDGRILPDFHAVKKDGSEHKTKSLWVEWWNNPEIYIIKEDGSEERVIKFIQMEQDLPLCTFGV